MAIFWGFAAISARGPLVARIKGVLDHDQSIVGLMALDIAAGRRWPIFFDGQRYMGALEAYVASAFVAIFGHSTVSIALAPLLFFGLFAAGQYLLWNGWVDRRAGHLAALIAVLGAPMPALWSIVPRGGYIEIMAWALAVLGAYRWMTQPEAGPVATAWQAAWGFLFALGYYLNPLSWIVYVALAIDWTIGRHGADLRRERRLDGGWIDSRRVAWAWPLGAGLLLVGLAVCCHVKLLRQRGEIPYVFLLDTLPRPLGMVIGGLGVVGLFSSVAWWTGAGRRAVDRLTGHTAFALGAMLALSPFPLHNLGVALGRTPSAYSLPIWIRAPWEIGGSLRYGAWALGPLVGCDPEAPATVLIGQGIDSPTHVWPVLARGLAWFSPVVVAVVLGLLARLTWRDRAAWRRFWTLRGEEPTTPTVLAMLVLAVAGLLFLVQATSLNGSSVRYLVPTWIVLPGLLACALRSLSRPSLMVFGTMLLVPWTLAQVNLWAEMDRPAPLRPIAEALDRRGVRGIVAETPVALMVANLTHGRVGAMEFGSKWPRLHDRYRDRFAPGTPVTCVVDVQLSWTPGEDQRAAIPTALPDRLAALSSRYPGRVRIVDRVDHFEVWEVDRPLDEILDEGGPLPSRAGSAKVSGPSRRDPEPNGAEPPCPKSRPSAGASSAAPGSPGAA